MKEFVEAGKVVNTHGIGGEIKLEVWLDSPAYFKSVKRLYLAGTAYELLSARVHKGFVIAKIKGVDDINTAMTLKGRVAEVRRDELPLEKDALLIQDIIGFTVVDEQGNTVGVMTDAEETPASMLYHVKGASEHLIPAVKEFILGIDAEKEEIRVHLIEGM